MRDEQVAWIPHVTDIERRWRHGKTAPEAARIKVVPSILVDYERSPAPKKVSAETIANAKPQNTAMRFQCNKQDNRSKMASLLLVKWTPATPS